MKRSRNGTLLLTAIALIGFMNLAACATTMAADRPNVVIFLADDAGWGDYSHSGNHQVSTPHIDSIANEGVSLDRFFVCPVCSPTRAEFLTGRYYPRGGVRGVSTGQERLDLSEKTLADSFKAAGYVTGAFGKWHNGSQWPYHPKARGFDDYFGYTAGHWGEYFDPPLEDNGRMIRSTGYIVDVCTDRAIQFVEANQRHPFLCYVPLTTPHSPWSVPQTDWARFKDKTISQTATDPSLEELDHTRCALAMLENQDRNVGRVLAKLDELKLREDTIVIYFSDNGPNSFRWNGGMKGRKGGTDEGSVRSVCYWRWPNHLPAGSVVPQIAGAIDLYPTLLSLTNVRRVGDKPLDEWDLAPLLRQQRDVEWSDRMLFTTWAGKFSVRTQRHRLDSEGRLFDMIADPGQSRPIQQSDPQTAALLKAAVEDWRQQMFGSSAQTAVAVAGSVKTDPVEIKPKATVDPRPFPVGYREFPITMLPARDGEPIGHVRRSASAPNCSYFVNWTSKDDQIVWLIDVHSTGKYRVEIDYTCPELDAGSLVELTCGSGRLTGKVAPGWDPPLFTNQDTIPRPPGESIMKDFHTLTLGEVQLEKGQSPLQLRALEIPGKTVMDVRRLTLTLLLDQ